MSVRAESSKPSGVAEIAISGGGGAANPTRKISKLLSKLKICL